MFRFLKDLDDERTGRETSIMSLIQRAELQQQQQQRRKDAHLLRCAI